jgi:recombination protein RecT
MNNQPATKPPMDVSRVTPPAGTLRDLLRVEEVKKRFEEVLGAHAGQFIASLASLVYRSPALQECEPFSVIGAALVAASLNLPIDPNLGYAAIVPYNDNKTGKKIAQFQMQWKGYVQLAHRTRQYANIHITEVYEGEIKSINRFTGAVSFGERKGDSITGYLAYLKLTNGFEKYWYMTIEQLQTHGKRYSKTYNNPKGMWKTDPEVMYRKTPIKLLLKTYGVLSVEMQKAIQAEAPLDEDAPQIEMGAEERARLKPVMFGEDEVQRDEAPAGQPDNAELDRQIMEKEVAAKAA